MLDLSGLNPQQREAVMHGTGPLLVLAGAGSGKTRVITYRIAYLMGEMGVRPHNILAVTFTNKAAAEMLHRVDQLVGADRRLPPVDRDVPLHLPRILRRYADRLGFTKSFAVYDTSDQMTLIRRCMRELNVNDDAFPPRSVLTRISHAKNELIGPVQYEKTNHDFFGARVAEIYRRYQKRLREFDAMDFDDLIGNYVQLLEQHEDVRDELHDRFQHLLVDEYQDTNIAQYVLVKLLAGKRRQHLAVGDEDQSIYSCRGADINNILNFERDFPGPTSSSWSRTTAPPGTSSTPRRAWSRTTSRARGRPSSPAAAKAIRCASSPAATTARRRSSSWRRSPRCDGSTSSPTSRCCSGRTRSRGPSKKSCCARTSRTRSSAA